MRPDNRRSGRLSCLVMLAGMMGWGASAADGTAPAQPALAPQMIVTPIKAEFQAACRSEALLQELRGHVSAGEKSKLQAMFDSQDCMVPAEQGRYRILKVRGGLIEIVSFFSRSATGYWASAESMRAVK
jgi:hypothetical protein